MCPVCAPGPELSLSARRKCEELARRFYAEATELSDTLLMDVAIEAWRQCLAEIVAESGAVVFAKLQHGVKL